METSRFFLTIPEIHGIFVDAILTDKADNLIFGSFWGRDTALREFQARLTLGASEGGLTTFNVEGKDCNQQPHKVFTRIGNLDLFDQMTGRVHASILGELVHCWLYSKDIIKPDMANHRSILIELPGFELGNLWQSIKAICPVPLLEHWGDELIPVMRDNDMIQPLDGVNLSGTQIVIDEDIMGRIVRDKCVDGSLRI